MPRREFEHAQDDVNLYILRMLNGIFSLNSAHVNSVSFPCSCK